MKNIKIIEKEMTVKETIENTPKGYRLLKINEVIKLVDSGELDNLMEKNKDKWRLFIFEPMFKRNKSLNLYSALASDWDDYGLIVVGNYFDYDGCGFAFGVYIKDKERVEK